MRQETAVQQLLGRYVRATDARDGKAMSDLFWSDGCVEIFAPDEGRSVSLGKLEGAPAIGHAVGSLLQAHVPRGWSHHTTHDLLVEVAGERATLDAQFIVFETLGDERPASGWPATVSGAQGSVHATESGYYRAELRCVDGLWKFSNFSVIHDLPVAFPSIDEPVSRAGLL